MKDAAFSIPSPQTLKAVITKLDELLKIQKFRPATCLVIFTNMS